MKDVYQHFGLSMYYINCISLLKIYLLSLCKLSTEVYTICSLCLTGKQILILKNLFFNELCELVF